MSAEVAVEPPATATRAEPMVAAHGLGKEFGDVTILDDVSLVVPSGQFLSIVGPSGCGKTTLLRILGGLTGASSGRVHIAGTPVTRPPKECVYVFQNYKDSLFGWRTVLKNVTFPLEGQLPKEQQRQRARACLDFVGLADHERKYPRQLSGGMQQRAAIARALAVEAEVLLFDEPFGALDAQTRMALQDQLLDLCQRLGKTVVFVTHDIDEALYLADRVLVLPSGAHAQQDVPVDLPRPRDQLATKADPRFAELRRRLFQLLSQDAAETDRAGA